MSFCSFLANRVPSRTRQRISSLVGTVDDPENVTRGQVAGPSIMLALEAIDVIRPVGYEGNARSVLKQMIEVLGVLERSMIDVYQAQTCGVGHVLAVPKKIMRHHICLITRSAKPFYWAR